MTDFTPPSSEESTPTIESSPNRLVTVVAILTAGATIPAVLWFALSGNTKPAGSGATTSSVYPIGIVNASQPSGEALPGPNALAHYNLAYVNNFTGKTLTADWDVFTGVPGGDAGGSSRAATLWSEVASSISMLGKIPRTEVNGLPEVSVNVDSPEPMAHLSSAPAKQALDQMTRELLWPKAPVWPPEIDFNENGGFVNSTSATVHFGTTNHVDQRTLGIDMTQWHTWGDLGTYVSNLHSRRTGVGGNLGRLRDSAAADDPRHGTTNEVQFGISMSLQVRVHGDRLGGPVRPQMRLQSQSPVSTNRSRTCLRVVVNSTNI